MAEQTVNMDLRKPAGTDRVNVTTDLCENFDKIDALAFMNRPSRTDPAPMISWNGSSVAVEGGLESKAPPTTLLCRTSAGTDDGTWCRIYTIRIQQGGNVSFRAAFDNIRTALVEHHGVMVTCRAYNRTSGSPIVEVGCSDSLRLPIKAAWIEPEAGDESGTGTLEIWAKNETYQQEHSNTPIWFGSIQWLYTVKTVEVDNYSVADTMVFPDAVGPVSGGPVDGDASTGKVYFSVVSAGGK